MNRTITLVALWAAVFATMQGGAGAQPTPAMPGMTMPMIVPVAGVMQLQANQIENRIGRLSPEVLQRRLLLLGYQPVGTLQVTSRLALGKLQVTSVAPSFLQTQVVQKGGVQFTLEIDPFTGFIRELR